MLLLPKRAIERNASHLAFVRQLPCCSCGEPAPSHAHHDTAGRGLGQKSDDMRTIPVCSECHDHIHRRRGRFLNMAKETMRAWHETQVQAVMRRKARAT